MNEQQSQQRAERLLKDHNEEIDYISKDGMDTELYDSILAKRIAAELLAVQRETREAIAKMVEKGKIKINLMNADDPAILAVNAEITGIAKAIREGQHA